ncbi:hypothetical protein GCM10009872_44580 [Actinopolymorpha rutila]
MVAGMVGPAVECEVTKRCGAGSPAEVTTDRGRDDRPRAAEIAVANERRPAGEVLRESAGKRKVRRTNPSGRQRQVALATCIRSISRRWVRRSAAHMGITIATNSYWITMVSES